MKSFLATTVGSAIIAVIATGAIAQQSTNRVAAKTDWSVFVEDDPTECWAVSSPKETINTKDGRVVAVRRSEILLFVSYRPGSGVKSELSFTGGYPFAKGSTVTASISGNTYEFFTSGENAWPASPEADVKIIAAMKRGAEVMFTGRSGRGTVTKDKFSLLGFTAAVEEAAKRCAK
ncbi:invasion associated locus B family protein [Profundibacter sp.]